MYHIRLLRKRDKSRLDFDLIDIFECIPKNHFSKWLLRFQYGDEIVLKDHTSIYELLDKLDVYEVKEGYHLLDNYSCIIFYFFLFYIRFIF